MERAACKKIELLWEEFVHDLSLFLKFQYQFVLDYTGSIFLNSCVSFKIIR